MKSTKSPAFQFYPNDFVGSGSVGMMTPDEVGVYVLLLCLEWNDHGFVFDSRRLAQWCRTSPAKFDAAWDTVRECFDERDGRWFNPRLDAERAKQAEWREKSHRGGIKSAEARSKGGSPMVATVVEPPYQPNLNTPFPSPTPVPAKAKALAAGAAAPESNLSKLPRETVDAAHLRWSQKFGALDYGRFRKALLPAFLAQPQVYTGAQLAAGVEAFYDGAQADKPEWRGKWTANKFAAELHNWVNLGGMEFVDEWGIPTERGRAARVFAESR